MAASAEHQRFLLALENGSRPAPTAERRVERRRSQGRRWFDHSKATYNLGCARVVAGGLVPLVPSSLDHRSLLPHSFVQGNAIPRWVGEDSEPTGMWNLSPGYQRLGAQRLGFCQRGVYIIARNVDQHLASLIVAFTADLDESAARTRLCL